MRGGNPSPTIDFVFRKLFGSEENKDLLISLINSIVEPRLHLTDVVIKNPFNLAAYKGSKESIVDIKAQDQDGNWYGIEMQVHGHIFYGKRAIFYAARGYVDQLEAGQHYSALNATIGIHFLDFDLFADSRMVRQFVFKDMETNEHPEQLKFLQLYFVELRKLHKGWPDISTPRDRWVAFMANGEGLHPQSLPATLLAEPAITKAVAELERMGADPELREIYEAEEKARMVDAAQLQYAERRGEQRGERRGEQRGEQRGRQSLLLHVMARHIADVPPHIAARLEKLTPNQLDELAEALFDISTYVEVEEWLSRQ
jgi:predicted transposase/invertase (TIGR01784 family)